MVGLWINTEVYFNDVCKMERRERKDRKGKEVEGQWKKRANSKWMWRRGTAGRCGELPDRDRYGDISIKIEVYQILVSIRRKKTLIN